MLTNRIDFGEMIMLDLFGGTGNHCFECISRGCTDTTYIDAHYPAIKFVSQISAALKIESKIQIIRSDVFKYLSTCTQKYSFIFAGPPYALPRLNQLPDLVFSNQLLLSSGIFVLEHNHTHHFDDHPNYEQVRKYGGTYFSFFTGKTDNEG